MPTANIGFEEKLWSMADKLRGTMMRRSTSMWCSGCFF
jgi:hypothetical protein